MKILLVLGKKLLANGEIPGELVSQVNMAVELMFNEMADKLVISGGVTRVGFPSEAQMAWMLLPLELRQVTRLETSSKTTRENILYVKEILLKEKIESIMVVDSASHRQRVLYQFRQIWPEMLDRLYYKEIDEPSTIVEKIFQKILYFLTIVDPKEKFFAPIQKIIFRGGL